MSPPLPIWPGPHPTCRHGGEGVREMVILQTSDDSATATMHHLTGGLLHGLPLAHSVLVPMLTACPLCACSWQRCCSTSGLGPGLRPSMRDRHPNSAVPFQPSSSHRPLSAVGTMMPECLVGRARHTEPFWRQTCKPTGPSLWAGLLRSIRGCGVWCKVPRQATEALASRKRQRL